MICVGCGYVREQLPFVMSELWDRGVGPEPYFCSTLCGDNWRRKALRTHGDWDGVAAHILEQKELGK